MENQIIIYGKNPTTQAITPISVSGQGQNTTINYLESIETADDFGTVPNPRINGEQLFYNSSSQKYDSRLREYFSLGWWGQQRTYSSPQIRQILSPTVFWNAYNYDLPGTFQGSSNFSLNTTNGVISGLTSTKYYKVDMYISLNSNNISTTTTWRLSLRDASSTTVRSGTIQCSTDDRFPSLCISWIGTGTTTLLPLLELTTGSYSTTQNPDCQFSMAIMEI